MWLKLLFYTTFWDKKCALAKSPMIEYYETIYTLSQIYIQFPKLQLE